MGEGKRRGRGLGYSIRGKKHKGKAQTRTGVEELALKDEKKADK